MSDKNSYEFRLYPHLNDEAIPHTLYTSTYMRRAIIRKSNRKQNPHNAISIDFTAKITTTNSPHSLTGKNRIPQWYAPHAQRKYQFQFSTFANRNWIYYIAIIFDGASTQSMRSRAALWNTFVFVMAAHIVICPVAVFLFFFSTIDSRDSVIISIHPTAHEIVSNRMLFTFYLLF